MGNGIPDDWYIEHSGESRILDQDKVAAELARVHSLLSQINARAQAIPGDDLRELQRQMLHISSLSKLSRG